MHGLSSEDGQSDENWEAMKQILTESSKKIQNKFQEAYLLPCIGNNDVLEHYKAPSIAQKD